jgi:hypothetical protein
VSTDRSQPATSGEDWFRPGTHSLWLYTREGRGEPALVAVYEWEIAGLRGITVDDTWGTLRELTEGESDWNADHQMLCKEATRQQKLSVQYFAELVATGHMLRIGEMPPVGKYAEPGMGF